MAQKSESRDRDKEKESGGEGWEGGGGKNTSMLLFRMVPGLKEASLQNDTGIQEREATPAERGRGGRGWLRVWGRAR